MKISAWHRLNGDITEIWQADKHYDKVYISKVFTESNIPDICNANEIVKGGSGFDLLNRMPTVIEHIFPDYNLYPEHNYALGFLTRGCPHQGHTFCITPKKDGCESVKVADITDFWNGQKNIVLLDQNILACRDNENLFAQLADTGARVDFKGGLDIRCINGGVIEALRKIKVNAYYFAWDDPLEDLYDKFRLIAGSGLLCPDGITVYILVNYWSTHEQDLMRIYRLRELNLKPYVMIYGKQCYVDTNGRWLPGIRDKYTFEQLRHFKICQHMQRWCNARRTIKTIPRFDDYDGYRNWVNKGMPCG